jgi:hypothetical protein
LGFWDGQDFCGSRLSYFSSERLKLSKVVTVGQVLNMSIREKILQETENASESILIEVLDYLQYLKIKHQQGMMETALLSEAILAEDWLKPEEEAAWQNL